MELERTGLAAQEPCESVARRALPRVGASGSLVEGLKHGDAEAYEQMVRRHGGSMLAVARRLLRSEEDARDAVQDAFLAVFRSIAGFEEGAALGTWLHRIVINASLMKLRSRQRRPEAPIEDLLPRFDDEGHRVDAGPPWPESAELALARREVRELVRRSIDELPETYRTVLLLRDIEDLDTAEVAGLLGTTPNAVKIRLHRARQALRELLDASFRGRAS